MSDFEFQLKDCNPRAESCLLVQLAKRAAGDSIPKTCQHCQANLSELESFAMDMGSLLAESPLAESPDSVSDEKFDATVQRIFDQALRRSRDSKKR